MGVKRGTCSFVIDLFCISLGGVPGGPFPLGNNSQT